jgi:MFS family permease
MPQSGLIGLHRDAVWIGERINPGWLTVLAGTVGLTFGPSTMTLLSFGIFVRPLQQEFGWTLGQTAFAATIISYMIMSVAPMQGALTDRFGGRAMVLASIPVFAASYALLYFLPNNLAVFYALWVLIPICGLGVWPLSYLRSTASWFDKRLGLALGITNAGIGVGSVLIPLLAGLLVANYGWRIAYLSLATIAFVVTWPLAFAFLTDKESTAAAKSSLRLIAGATLKKAIQTRTFVIVAIVFFVLGALNSSLIVLQVPMLIEAGLSPVLSATLASLAGIAMIITRIGTGYLLDRFHASKVLMCFILISSLAAVAFAIGVTRATAPIAALLIGAIIGAEFDALSYIIPRYYGDRSFGKIYGVVFAIFQLGSGIGVAAVAFSHDRFGSFRPSMWILATLTVMAGLLFSRLGPYRFAAEAGSKSSAVASDTAASWDGAANAG